MRMQLYALMFVFALFFIGCASSGGVNPAGILTDGIAVPRAEAVQFQQALALVSLTQAGSGRAEEVQTVNDWLTKKLAADQSDPLKFTLYDAMILYMEWRGGKLAAIPPPVVPTETAVLRR